MSSVTTEPTSSHVVLDGVRLHYLDWGNDGAPVLLLLHGFTGHAHQWGFFADEWGRDFHVLALDQRGHGDSDTADRYGTRPMVEDIGGFLEALSLDDVTLVGMSMGGMNSLVYAAMHPERVAGIVLGDIGPEIAEVGVQRIRQHVASRDTFASVDEAFEWELARNPRATPWMLRSRVEGNLKALPDGQFTWKYDRALRDGTATREEMAGDDRWALWSALTVPTLIVRGAESDVLSTDIAERMLASQPNAELITIEDAGHTLTTDRPEEFRSVVSAWLSERAAARDG
jgi:pimeloyl-ACP methyl ester carboxylesterase